MKNYNRVKTDIFIGITCLHGDNIWNFIIVHWKKIDFIYKRLNDWKIKTTDNEVKEFDIKKDIQPTEALTGSRLSLVLEKKYIIILYNKKLLGWFGYDISGYLMFKSIVYCIYPDFHSYQLSFVIARYHKIMSNYIYKQS